METIRKKICFDNFISHRNGISPYVSKDNDDVEIKYVTTTSSNSNYGSFPCDFVLNNSEYYTDDETNLRTRKSTEISRLKYLDVLRWYNDVNEIIRDGKMLKRIDYSYDKINKVICTSPSDSVNNCGAVNSATTLSETINTSLWAVDNDCENTIFDCVLVDLSLLKQYGTDKYEYDELNTVRYKAIKEHNIYSQDNLPEEELKFVEKMDYFVFGSGNVDVVSSYNGTLFSLSGNERAFAIGKYYDYLEYEDKWNSWWSGNCELCTSYSGGTWESFVFDSGYTQPSGLTFIYDFEKYILGKLSVPEKYNGEDITGSKVPNTVFYLNYMDYLTWFNTNSEYLSANEDLQGEWEKRGGEKFKTFLENISTKFIDIPQIPENNSFIYFDFAYPNIEIDLAFTDEFYNECTYVPYEYSVGENGELIDATIPYEKGGNGEIESALTPAFVNFGSSGIASESQLSSLYRDRIYRVDNEVYGIFNEFPKGGKLFKCQFYSGSSSENDIIKCSSGTVQIYAKTNNGEWNLLKTMNVNESENEFIHHEKLPNSHGAYQVVGIEEIGSSVTFSDITHSHDESLSDNGTMKVVSTITNYVKSISKTYSWCECCYESGNIQCGDGEDLDFSDTANPRYRKILLLSCVPYAVEDNTPGKTYYYLAQYDNGYTNVGSGRINSTCYPKSLRLPLTFEKKNIESCKGEFSGVVKYDQIISSAITSDNTMTIEYVIGAIEGEDIYTSGIHYVDKYHYYGNVIIDAVVDGRYKAKILYEKTTPYNETAYFNGKSRSYVPSKITGMKIGSPWTPESALRAYLFTEDTYDNLIEYPNIDVSITFNRGNAAAWENHFKLSECNTFEDLQNYGNNYFNL